MSVDDPDLPHSFVRSLLSGHVDLSPLQPYPRLAQGRVRQVEELIAKIRRDERRESGVESLKEWGLLGAPHRWSASLLARVIRQAGATDPSAALCAIAHVALGTQLVHRWGSEEQVRMVEQDPSTVLAFALTEASPGSDVSRVQTYAEPDGKGFLLSGTKHWVTNAKDATHFIVVARTVVPRAGDKPKLTAFLVPLGPGVEVVPVRAQVLPGAGVSEVRFSEVRLGSGQVLGQVGKGFRVVMQGLAEARLHVAAAALGACIRAVNDTIARLKERRAFGRSIARFPSVQSSVATMISEVLALESLVHAVSGLCEQAFQVDPVERAVVRLAASRASTRVLDAARELHGASAFVGDTSVANHWADTRALTLLDGSDHALQSYIVLEGTRKIRHRFSVMAGGGDPLLRLDAAASHLYDKASARLRRVTGAKAPELALDHLHGLTARLSEEVDRAIRRHGREFVEKQHTHRRLAVVTAELAAWLAVAARVLDERERRGEVGARRMSGVAEVFITQAKGRIEEQLGKLLRNDDSERDRVAHLAYGDEGYPFDIF